MNVPDPRANWALFLDFDGTLVDIADRPDAVIVDPALPELLRSVSERLSGALAVISGRPISEIDHFLHDSVMPVAGLHGVERRDAEGDIRIGEVPADRIDAARERLTAFAAEHDGVLLEDKKVGLVLHYRLAPDRQADCEAMTGSIAAESNGRLVVQPGKMVSELKVKGHHKGQAVEAFLSVPPFVGRTPVFVGDDVTDEDAFAVVNALDGISIRVGPRDGTQARYVAGGVEDIRKWLRRLASDDGQEANTL